MSKQNKEPKGRNKRIAISVRLLELDYNTLKKLAENDVRPISRYVEKIIMEHVKEMACTGNKTERG